MTRKQYKTRIKRAGLTIEAWANHCRVTRDAIHKQIQKDKIPHVYWIALDKIDGLGIPENGD